MRYRNDAVGDFGGRRVSTELLELADRPVFIQQLESGCYDQYIYLQLDERVLRSLNMFIFPFLFLGFGGRIGNTQRLANPATDVHMSIFRREPRTLQSIPFTTMLATPLEYP
jgi:hypothetical protein